MFDESNEMLADAYDEINAEREADEFAANLETAEEVAEFEQWLDEGFGPLDYSDDGDALASAGMGTDEDYFAFGEE